MRLNLKGISFAWVVTLLPLLSAQVCYALAQLAAGFRNAEATSLFSPYFKDIVAALLEAVRPQHPSSLLVSSISPVKESGLPAWRGSSSVLPDRCHASSRSS